MIEWYIIGALYALGTMFMMVEFDATFKRQEPIFVLLMGALWWPIATLYLFYVWVRFKWENRNE